MKTWNDVFFAAVHRGDDPFRAMDVADAWKKRTTPRDTAWRLSRGVISDVDDYDISIPQGAAMYQIGRAEHPHSGDPYFDTEAEALAEAQRAAADNADAVYAVWRWMSNGDAEALYLVYQGDTWEKAY